MGSFRLELPSWLILNKWRKPFDEAGLRTPNSKCCPLHSPSPSVFAFASLFQNTMSKWKQETNKNVDLYWVVVDWVVHTFNPSAGKTEAEEERISEFEASLVWRVSSRTPELHGETLSKKSYTLILYLERMPPWSKECSSVVHSKKKFHNYLQINAPLNCSPQMFALIML